MCFVVYELSDKDDKETKLETEKEDEVESEQIEKLWLNVLFEKLSTKTEYKNEIEKLNKFLSEQEYDTDAIDYDVKESKESIIADLKKEDAENFAVDIQKIVQGILCKL